MRHARTTLPLLLALAASGCGMIPIKGKIKTVTTVNGKTTTREVKFDKLEDLPGALSSAAGDLQATTGELVKQLTEAPPPGEVQLGQLAPALKPYEGDAQLDFLKAGRAQKVSDFKYVRIGVPSYDGFFRSSAEFYALAYQTRQSVARLRQISGALLEKEPGEDVSLAKLVSEALAVKATPKNRKLHGQLAAVKKMTVVLARSAPLLVKKSQALVASGQQLIAGAAASITNPKTALHLDLIKEGLEQSVAVITESAGLLGELTGELSGF